MTIFNFWYFWVDWWKWWKAMWLTRQGVGVSEGWNLQCLLVISEFCFFFFKSLSLYLNWMKGQILAFSQKKSWRFLKESPPFHVSCLSPIAVFAFMGKLAFPPHNAQCCNTFVNNISLLVLLLLHSILSTVWASCLSHRCTMPQNSLISSLY